MLCMDVDVDVDVTECDLRNGAGDYVLVKDWDACVYGLSERLRLRV